MTLGPQGNQDDYSLHWLDDFITSLPGWAYLATAAIGVVVGFFGGPYWFNARAPQSAFVGGLIGLLSIMIIRLAIMIVVYALLLAFALAVAYWLFAPQKH